jgi:hypothetical protein
MNCETLISLAAEHGLNLRALDDADAYDWAVMWLSLDHPRYLDVTRGCPHEAMRLSIGSLKTNLQWYREDYLARRLRRRMRLRCEIMEGQRALFSGQQHKCCAQCDMPKLFSSFGSDRMEPDGYCRVCRTCEAKRLLALRRCHGGRRRHPSLVLWRWFQQGCK